MNENYRKDCEQWAGGRRVGFLWKLKHYILFPSFRIITWKRIGESYDNPIIRNIAKYKLFKYTNKYLITLPLKTVVGGGISFPHGGPIVFTGGAKIGENVMIHPNVLIGGQEKVGCPTIGSRVFIGNGAKIVGKINVGDDVFIAPGTIVVKDIPSGSVIVGNPARIINNNGAKYVRQYLFP